VLASAKGKDRAVTPADLIGDEGLIALTEQVNVRFGDLQGVPGRPVGDLDE
jgi:hypothetical protein